MSGAQAAGVGTESYSEEWEQELWQIPAPLFRLFPGAPAQSFAASRRIPVG